MNNKLTDETLKAWKTEAMISLGETPKDCRDYYHHEAILTLVTELQELRAAMLQSSQPVSDRDELPVIGGLRSDYNSDDKRDPNAPLFMLGSNDPSDTWGVKYIPLSGNSLVISDDWVSCSERMPAQDDWVLIYSKYGEYLAGQVQGEYVELNDGTLSWLGSALHWMPLPAPPQH
ncbi:DUF551 domain-containing protein [Salmonella enterica]|nr:DUF551 domain-containing protein [Salmonella enterica]